MKTINNLFCLPIHNAIIIFMQHLEMEYEDRNGDCDDEFNEGFFDDEDFFDDDYDGDGFPMIRAA